MRRILEANLCRVNGKVERFGSATVQRGDVVELSPAWQSLLTPKQFQSFPILYEDETIRMVDKPSGWVCSPENCVSVFGKGCALMHRLDRDTTGVLALAKSKETLDTWTKLFAERKLEKEYLAIVDGIPKQKEGVIESRLARKKSIQGQTIWGSALNGLHAVTHWELLAAGSQASLLLCKPKTGRTHQIRVHLAEMGHPILVDRQYAPMFRSSFPATRTMLHAYRLAYDAIDVRAPMPSDMQKALPVLGLKVGHLAEFLCPKD